MKRIKPQHQSIANILALATLPLSGFATDIYVPSLPAMSTAIHVGSLEVQSTITIFLLSYGLSQLFIGSVLDSFGRYRIGLVSLLLFTLSSLAIAWTHDIRLIYGMRVVQGITVGAVIAGKRAYFVDLFSGDKLKSYLSIFSIIWSTGPIIAPFVGGWLQTFFGWESNFYGLAVLGGLLVILEYAFSGETLAASSPFQLKKVVTVYGGMLKSGPFMLGITMLGLAYGMVMVYNMTGSFVIEHHLHLSVVTAGYCSLILGFAWMVGGFISKAVIRHHFFKKLAVNVALQLSLAVLMIAIVRQTDNLYVMVAFAFLIHVCAGFTFNNYITFCLTRFPHNAGVASGLTGGLTFLMVSALSYGIVGVLPAKDAQNLASSYLVQILGSIVIMGLVFRGFIAEKKSGVALS